MFMSLNIHFLDPSAGILVDRVKIYSKASLVAVRILCAQILNILGDEKM